MTTPQVSRAQALTWRMRRQHLLGGAADPTEVVRTLAAVSVFGSDADLAVRRRLASPREPGEVQRALADGRLMRTFSFRGSVQVMAPEAVVLLPGKDDWVMGPGTQDTWVVPPERRAAMTRGGNPVLVDGVVAGTWRVSGGVLDVGVPPSEALAAEADRLASLLGSGLELRTP